MWTRTKWRPRITIPSSRKSVYKSLDMGIPGRDNSFLTDWLWEMLPLTLLTCRAHFDSKVQDRSSSSSSLSSLFYALHELVLFVIDAGNVGFIFERLYLGFWNRCWEMVVAYLSQSGNNSWNCFELFQIDVALINTDWKVEFYFVRNSPRLVSVISANSWNCFGNAGIWVRYLCD